MWKWINCYLSGKHNFAISCATGEIFLKCSHCGRRTPGWAVDPKWQRRSTASAQPTSPKAASTKAATLPIAS
jgi:hypothetical protein